MDFLGLQPIINKPVIHIQEKNILVLADIHIGIEAELRNYGVNVKSQTKKMTQEILSLCNEKNCKELIFLGDIKHNIPMSTFQERKDVKSFLKDISKTCRVHIIPGNHDGNIKKLICENVEVHPSDGMIFENTGFFHGHRWPKKEIMNCKTVVMAHTHPTIMFSDRRGYKNYEPCWIKAEFLKEKLKEKYPQAANTNLIILPAFNPLCGGIAVNKDGIVGPFKNLIDLQNSLVYLTDGSFLGKVKNIK